MSFSRSLSFRLSLVSLSGILSLSLSFNVRIRKTCKIHIWGSPLRVIIDIIVTTLLLARTKRVVLVVLRRGGRAERADLHGGRWQNEWFCTGGAGRTSGSAQRGAQNKRFGTGGAHRTSGSGGSAKRGRAERALRHAGRMQNSSQLTVVANSSS